jgi:Flp pilus assembly protein TadD
VNLKIILEKFEDAINDLDKVVALESTNPMHYMKRAEAKLKANDKAGACKDWHTAVYLGYQEAVQKVLDNCN